MPKIQSTLFLHHSFQPVALTHSSLEETKPEIHCITHIPRFRRTHTSKSRYSPLSSRSPEQEASWLHEAHCRASGCYILQRPEHDVFQAQGRTIYNTLRPIRRVPQFQHELDQLPPLSPSALAHPRPLGRRRSLLDETIHQVEGGKSLHRRLSSPLDVIPEVENIEPLGSDEALFDAVEVVFPEAQEDPAVDDAVSEVSGASTPSLTWTYSSFEIKEPATDDLVDPADEYPDFFSKYETMDQLFDMYINAAECQDF
ncbi:unnamed protein product [Cyclocybe aegerita]|uniref:Uncharacterized protein n=1 Tax=Cyclocybe aegerita TaxID=1973307 RepID=A0A8S0WC56_CYCAE|nr:unnamed protein product [Cyclocybe aegerita]